MSALGGFFGSGGKETITETITYTDVDNINAEGNGNNISTIGLQGINNSTVSIQATDYGALDAAAQIANTSLNTVRETSSSAASTIRSAFSEAAELAKKAAESDTTETIKYLVVGLSAVGIAWALKGKFF